MKFGSNLRKLRKKEKLSQEELAEKVGVSRQSVSKWECDDTYPEMANIITLCNIFKCKIQDLASDEEILKIIDLEKMKDLPISIEGTSAEELNRIMKEQGINFSVSTNVHDHFLDVLEDFYISKSNGIARIKGALKEWDAEARKTIILNLIDRLKESGIFVTFDDIKELIELI